MGSKDVQIKITSKDEASKGITGVRNQVGSLCGDLKTLKSGLLAIEGVKALGPMILGVAGAAKEWGLAVDDIVDQTGAAGEEASKLLVIAKRTGIGIEESAGIFAKFGKSISKAKDEMATAAAKGEESDDIFSRMGFTMEDLQGDMYSVFQKLTEKMRDMADGADKDRVAMEMFGKSGYKMHDMLSISRDEMDKVIKKAQDMGLIISGDTAAAWEQFDRQLQGVKGTASKLAIGIGNELLPAVQGLLTKVDDLVSGWATLNEAQRQAAGRSIELAAEIGGVVTVLWGAEKAAMALKGALLLLSRHPVITIAITSALIGSQMNQKDIIGDIIDNDSSGMTEEQIEALRRLKEQNNVNVEDSNVSRYKDHQINKFPTTAASTVLRPTAAGGGGGKDLDNMREKLANMIADFNAKITNEVGTTFEGNAAKLAAEITKASQEFAEMEAKGIDTSIGRSKLDEYSKVMTEKYKKEQSRALLALQTETASINAAITDDYVVAAEAQYKAELQSIVKQVEERKKASGNTTAVLEWEVAATKQAEQKKLQAVIDGEAKKHEQRLYHLEYQRNVMGMTSQLFTAEYQKELQSYIDTNTAKLANTNMTADERYRIEQNVSSAVEKLHRLEGQNINTAWKEAMRRMETDSFDYAGNIVSMFDEIGSSISSNFADMTTGATSFADGFGNIFKSLTNSIIKMWWDMVTQMYIMTPLKSLFGNILGGGSGGIPGLAGQSGSAGGLSSIFGATGGAIIGPGTGTSDSIPAWLSNGEYVINAAAVDKYGTGFFDAVNTRRFATGGAVGGGSTGLLSGGGQNNKFVFAPVISVASAGKGDADNMVAALNQQWSAFRSQIINDLKNNSSMRSAVKGATK